MAADTMSWLFNPTFVAADWLALFGHFVVLSLLAVGGAIATAPDMHRYVVGERGWLSDGEFTASVALAQAAPGPNVLFVAVIGFNVAGLAGAMVTMLGNLLPSATLALGVARYGHRRSESLPVRAFSAGMAPLTLGLILATGWVLTEPMRGSVGAMALVAATVLVMWRTRLSPMWLIGIGALAGGLGWV
jgi:chromate transporter